MFSADIDVDNPAISKDSVMERFAA